MAREVNVGDDAVEVRLTGWTAAAAVKRRLRIPRDAIRSVSTEPYRHDGLRIAGTGLPFSDYRQGRFRRRGGAWTFLSFEDRAKTVTLELDRARAGFDRVVLGVDDPEGFARSLGVH
jgi:hypothetical protein